MKYVTFGSTGLLVSQYAFGAMTFGQSPMVPGVVNHIPQDTADRMTAMALDAGVNFFDTADAYCRGESETMLGKALRGKRGQAVIATKAGFRTADDLNRRGLSQRHVIASCQESLKRLGTDYIDLYFMHIPDPLTPFEETAHALGLLVRKGMVRYTGFSNFPAWMAAQFIGMQEKLGYQALKGAQLHYSLLCRDIERELAPMLQSCGLGLMAWSPLSSGFLTGKYSKDAPVPDGVRRKNFQFPPIDIALGYRVVEELRSVAAARNATPAQVALAWTASKPFVNSVLIGANSEKQLEENLKAATLHLDEADIRRLDGLTAPAASYPQYMLPMGLDPMAANALQGLGN